MSLLHSSHVSALFHTLCLLPVNTASSTLYSLPSPQPPSPGFPWTQHLLSSALHTETLEALSLRTGDRCLQLTEQPLHILPDNGCMSTKCFPWGFEKEHSPVSALFILTGRNAASYLLTAILQRTLFYSGFTEFTNLGSQSPFHLAVWIHL